MTAITARLDEGYAVDLESTQGHEWRSDEAEEHGGDDTGPDPYEMLLGALAACTCITVSMFCQRKGWDLTRISARFSHGRIHTDDCERCEDEQSGFIDRITSEITIVGAFDDTQQARVREAAQRCPVRKTLQKGMVVDDNITFQA